MTRGDSPMLALLERGAWEEHQPAFDALSGWPLYHLLLETLEGLDHEALFVSKMHGLGHIERTVLQGGFCAQAEGLGEADTRLLLEACCYHDVGRVNDWVDREHGYRSAQQIGRLTGRTGEELLLLQGAVDAHARREEELCPTLERYPSGQPQRALALAQLLKDADGLDRVRLGDLDPAYLRRESSRTRVALAQEVFRRYQVAIGMPPEPFFTPEQIARYQAMDPNTPPPKS